MKVFQDLSITLNLKSGQEITKIRPAGKPNIVTKGNIVVRLAQIICNIPNIQSLLR